MLASIAFLVAAAASDAGPTHVDVAAYYFPGYHADPRIDARKGKGWTEWDLTRAAKPRFEGHDQPRVPAWGYEDESDPTAMAKKIAAAADNGLDAFIFDWYWYEDKPYLNRALDDGFLKARNRGRLKFALMWANHDWLDCMPATEGKPLPLIYTGAVDATVSGASGPHPTALRWIPGRPAAFALARKASRASRVFSMPPSPFTRVMTS